MAMTLFDILSEEVPLMIKLVDGLPAAPSSINNFEPYALSNLPAAEYVVQQDQYAQTDNYVSEPGVGSWNITSNKNNAVASGYYIYTDDGTSTIVSYGSFPEPILIGYETSPNRIEFCLTSCMSPYGS